MDEARKVVSGLNSRNTDGELEKRLKDIFGYDEFKPTQRTIIEHVVNGGSVLGVMPTGAGKSLCYQLPAMLTERTTLVVSPLIALMKDQVDGLPDHAQACATVINSSLDSDELARRLQRLRSGGCKLVYAAPERLRQLPFLHGLRRAGVSLFVIDEAHCLSAWGHDFRPDYLFIGHALEYLGNPHALALTATATSETQLEITKYLGQNLRTVNAGTFRPNLRLEARTCYDAEGKMRELVPLCREIEGSGIVYVSSREHAERLAGLLRRNYVKAQHYHAGLESEERTRVQDDFMDDRYRVMVATVAFGMGVDKPDIRFVIHFSLPHSVENYYQEAGRAGRDGKLSRCILLSTPSDKANLTRWMRSERVSIENLRDIYRSVGEYVPVGGHGPVHDDDLQRDTGLDETRVRVAVSMLEKAGMLVRRLDLPTTVTVMMRNKQDPQFATFAEQARLRPNQSLALSAVELAKRTGVPITDLEGLLLDYQDKGCISYHGSGRAMFLERPRATPEMRAKLDEIIDKYARSRTERVERMAEYARADQCRHGMIAAHFGDAPIHKCGVCDICAPSYKHSRPAPKPKVASVSSGKDIRRTILQTVSQLPYPLGKTGLTRLLKGSILSSIKRGPLLGLLSGETKSAIENAITELVDSGCLERDTGEYPTLHLTAKGRAELSGR